MFAYFIIAYRSNERNGSNDIFRDNITKPPVFLRRLIEYRKLKSGSNLSAISKETREYIAEHWNTLEDKIKLVPGKELKAKVYDWMKTAYGFSCNDKKILALMESSDIPDELIAFLKELNT